MIKVMYVTKYWISFFMWALSIFCHPAYLHSTSFVFYLQLGRFIPTYYQPVNYRYDIGNTLPSLIPSSHHWRHITYCDGIIGVKDTYHITYCDYIYGVKDTYQKTHIT